MASKKQGLQLKYEMEEMYSSILKKNKSLFNHSNGIFSVKKPCQCNLKKCHFLCKIDVNIRPNV